ncbi:thioesterase domain-containing protein, partial [Neoroseomonas soli]
MAGLLLLGACGPTRLAPLAGPPRGRVVLLRGLANVFSTGLNVLTARLRQAGYDASVHNHVEWSGLADASAQAARERRLVRPLVLVGHSFGADDALSMAERLGMQGVAADLVVTFDPTTVTRVPPGPLRVVNFHQDRDFGTRALSAAPGFTGTIENRIVPGESHLSIEKQERLHDQVLAMLEALYAAQAMPPVVSARAPRPRLVAPPP